MKKSALTLSVVFTSLCLASSAFASTGHVTTVSSQVQEVDNRTQLLEQQVRELQAKVSGMSHSEGGQGQHVYLEKSGMLEDSDLTDAVHAHSRVSFGPYLNIRTKFNGSELLVNTSSIRESSRLLQRRYNVQEAAKKAGKPRPEVPHMILSGVLGGQVFQQQGYGSARSSDIDLTDAEIDTYILMNHWISGFMAITYDNGTGTTSREVDHANIKINKAFMMFGDLEQTPVYASLGQFYVPFGRYSSSMIAAPLTQKLARTKERAFLIGYKDVRPNSVYGEVYTFGSSSGFASERTTVNDAGADLGFDFKTGDRLTGEVGVSWISNIADSSGIQDGSSTSGGFAGMSCSTCSQAMGHRVPGFDVYGQVSFGQFNLVAENVMATRHFDTDVGLLSGSSSAPAKPKAQNVELGYTFDAFNRPSAFIIGYGHTSDAVMLGLPTRRYSMGFDTSIWKHTLEMIELRREYNYSTSAGTPVTGDSAEQLGKSSNVITAQIYVYF